MNVPEGLRPRLIAVDLDGTLVPQSGDVPAGVAEAVERVTRQGAIVVATTGRSLTTTGYVARAAGMHQYAIVSNGAMLITVDPESVVSAMTYDASDLVSELVALLPDATFAVERPDGVFLTNRHFVDGGVSHDIREVTLDELTAEPVVRVVIRSDAHLGEGLGAFVQHLDTHTITFGVTDVAWVDLGIKGINKATGLAALCEHLGIDAPDVLAIGDAMNDLEMLAWAGTSVAMGHARQPVKDAADYVTSDQPGQGVIDVLNRLYV